VWVIDVGGRYEPKLHNFDHHQFDRDAEPVTAFTLILDHFGRLELSRRVYPWVDFSVMMDTKGPVFTADWVGMDRYMFYRVMSPIEEHVLRVFGSQHGWHYTDPTWVQLLQMGRQQLDYMDRFAERFEWLTANAKLVSTPSRKVPVIACLVAQLSDPALSMNAFREANPVNGRLAAVSITPDDRGSGWTLYRFNDDPRVDFSRLEGHHEISFAHRGGFVAKTKSRCTATMLWKLIDKADPEGG
jgi:hypothetical protein